MDITKAPLDDIEIEARSHLDDLICQQLSLVQRVFDLTATALYMERQPSDLDGKPSHLVTTHLLGRISRDTRCIALLTQIGYTMQAASLAACAFEAGLAIVYVGDDDTIAGEWLKHHLPKPWRNVKELLNKSIKKLAPENSCGFEQTVDQIYENVYAPVAAAKHSNPNMERLHLVGEKIIDSSNGPIVSEMSVRITEHALLCAVYANIIALYSFANTHLPANNDRYILLKSVRELESEYSEAVKKHNKIDKMTPPTCMEP